MAPLDGRPVGPLWVHGRPAFWLAPHEEREAVRIGRAVQRRTGLHPFLNLQTGGIFFSLTDTPEGGPIEAPFKRRGKPASRYSDSDIDDMCLAIGMARQSRKDKDRIAARNAQFEEWRRQERLDKDAADRRPDTLSYAGFLDRRRRGVAKVIGTP